MTGARYVLPVTTPAWVEEIHTDEAETTYDYHPVLAWVVADDGSALFPMVAFGGVSADVLTDTDTPIYDDGCVTVRILRTAPGEPRTTTPRVDHLTVIRRQQREVDA